MRRPRVQVLQWRRLFVSSDAVVSTTFSREDETGYIAHEFK